MDLVSAEVGKPFNASSEEEVCRLIQCTQAALPFFSVSYLYQGCDIAHNDVTHIPGKNK